MHSIRKEREVSRRLIISGIILSALFCSARAFAQLNINNFSPIQIDFSGFDGSGFQPGGGSGTLDSNVWKVMGCSDGDTTYGGTHTTGDFARGLNDGGTTTGGVYAWDVIGDQSVIALGVQPAGSDLTPGNMVLRLYNNTGQTIESFQVSFDRWVNNDQGRANTLDFGCSLIEPSSSSDTGTILDWYTTPEASDANGFVSISASVTFDVTVNDGETVYLIWSTDDVSGSGSRDEFGITDISITPSTEPSLVELVSFKARSGKTRTQLTWETASEIDSAGFNIWRSEKKNSGFRKITRSLIPSQGGPTSGAKYKYDDLNLLPGKTYYYKLEDIDYQGKSTFHRTIAVTLKR